MFSSIDIDEESRTTKVAHEIWKIRIWHNTTRGDGEEIREDQFSKRSVIAVCGYRSHVAMQSLHAITVIDLSTD